jgi:hypothetical protein
MLSSLPLRWLRFRRPLNRNELSNRRLIERLFSGGLRLYAGVHFSLDSYKKTRLPRPRRSQQTGLFARIIWMSEWGSHAEASARRLQLRVTTPLASTAIFHLVTSFQNFVRRFQTRCQPEWIFPRTERKYRDAFSRHDALIIPTGQIPARKKSSHMLD